MTEYEALRVDSYPIDDELRDAGAVGPELAHLAGVYLASPRALLFRNPSSDWRLFVLLLPIASRLSLMRNPVFANLVRAWGLNLRLIGIDRFGLVHDFRALLSNRTLGLLVDWLGELESATGRRAPRTADAGLDLLFAALAEEMLTVLERSDGAWGRHLDLTHRLEPDVPASLFDRRARYPDFIAALRAALRNGIVDVHTYGRAFRAVELREAALEQRVGAQIEACLDPVAVAKLVRSGAGRHLGCYNWLALSPKRAAMRAHVLGSLPALAAHFAAALVPLDVAEHDARRRDGFDAGALPGDEPTDFDAASGATSVRGDRRRSAASLDLQRQATGDTDPTNVYHAARLRAAVDAGQDRIVIDALADRFRVPANLVRRLWREQPQGLGQPPAWQLPEVLRRIADAGERGWPRDDAQWRELVAAAVPAAAR